MAEIIYFQPRYLADYVSLNREWIEKYFVVEATDIAQLESPHDQVLAPGGEIFFAVAEGRALGVCAMIPHGPNCYELAKMAVAPEARGQGLGDLLITAALDWARAKRAQRVMLLSNTILEPAIALYHKHGFRTVRLMKDHPDYARANIEMEIALER